MEKTEKTGKIESLQALRGIAALFVVLEHVSFLKCGLFAVDLFFVLSGFMIVLSTEKGMEHFLVKRIIRIVPFYWLFTVVTFLGVKLLPHAFESTEAGIKELLYSLFFIPFDINTGSAFGAVTGTTLMQPIMRIGWTLNLEMFFYLIFFVGAKINFKYRAVVTSVILTTLALAGQFNYSYVEGSGVVTHVPAFSIWGSPLLFEFIMGMATYYICMLVKKKTVPKALASFLGLAALIMMLVLSILRKEAMFTDANRLLIWGLPGVIILLFAYMYGMGCKTPKFLVFAGEISFSIYYVHYYIVRIYDRLVISRFGSGVVAYGILFVTILVIVLASIVTNELIEKRFTKFLMNTLIK